MDRKTVQVFAAEPMDFTSKEDGKRVQGARVYFLPVQEQQLRDGFGWVPQQRNIMGPDAWAMFAPGPGLYELDITYTTWQGVDKVKIIGARFVGEMPASDSWLLAEPALPAGKNGK